MSDTNERSVASAGSVAGEPVAWGVLLADGERIYDVYDFEEEAKAIDEAVTGNHGVVPLYRSPTLTDDEREAVSDGLRSLERDIYSHREDCGGAYRDMREHAATLRGLLERLK